MALLIGTDEAGYGPTLGPLVIVATAWRVQDGRAEAAFANFDGGLEIADGGRIAIADSKQLFKPRAGGGLAALESAVAAFTYACGGPPDSTLNGPCSPDWLHTPNWPRTLGDLLARLASEDHSELAACPWYADLDVPFPSLPASAEDEQLWSLVPPCLAEQGIELLGIAARVIDAAPFNRMCETAGNKASLLSETTLQLASRRIDAGAREAEVHVYCDRHGGRHRYGALLQHTRPDGMLHVLREGSPESHYRLHERERTIDWRFTVQGDQFMPVALASMFAKYLRERLMERFNAFWQFHHCDELRATAGYPTDAGRYCQQIAPIAKRLGIDSATYIRSR